MIKIPCRRWDGRDNSFTNRKINRQNMMGNSYSMLRKNFPRAFEVDQKLIEAAAKAEEERRKEFSRKELLRKYDLEFIQDNNDIERLIGILQLLDAGSRISEEDVFWLSIKRNNEGIYWCCQESYFAKKVKRKYHKNEAEFYAEEFKKNSDCWMAVNASSHYRKCEESKNAEQLLDSIDVDNLKNEKLKSAIYTTHGGAKRDSGKLKEALQLGDQAHVLTPQDFRPCTLIGAVNIEMGNYDEGRIWYDKAVERGYTEKAVDDELRNIFMRAEKSKQDKLREYLLNIDPFRYSWVKKVHKKHN